MPRTGRDGEIGGMKVKGSGVSLSCSRCSKIDGKDGCTTLCLYLNHTLQMGAFKALSVTSRRNRKT